VLILSQYVQAEYAVELLTEDPRGIGYILKQRVTDVDELVTTIERVTRAGSVIDPEIAALLVRRRRQRSPIDNLTEREREVLQLMAEGRSNQGIVDRLQLSLRTVEAHIRSIFSKLGLLDQGDHRRVLAVLTYLRSLDNPSPG
jgi:DNA-binding NarL/FixJ family response regulator